MQFAWGRRERERASESGQRDDIGDKEVMEEREKFTYNTEASQL